MSDRRNFIKNIGLVAGVSALPISSSLYASAFKAKQKKLGVCLVGLGYYSRDLLAPALQETEHCYLAGIVTGSPDKIPVWQKKYDIKDSNVYNYENMHKIANNKDIDVIYIVLPTGMHAEYAIKAADTGKHVWCEKPMAKTVEECQQIINACNKNKVHLSIGYRMHHEPNTQLITEWAKDKPYGDLKNVIAAAGYRGNYKAGTDDWKLTKKYAGGAMYDMGVYPLNACRYATGEEPLAVTGHHAIIKPEVYTEVDATTYFQLEFPSGVTAKCKTSFEENVNQLLVTADKGWYELSPFQSYTGVKGTTSDGKVLNPFTGNQQAKQMDENSLAIINNKPPLVPGKEGLKDIKVVEAVYKAAATNSRVVI